MFPLNGMSKFQDFLRDGDELALFRAQSDAGQRGVTELPRLQKLGSYSNLSNIVSPYLLNPTSS